jgi:hypothetical protein
MLQTQQSETLKQAAQFVSTLVYALFQAETACFERNLKFFVVKIIAEEKCPFEDIVEMGRLPKMVVMTISDLVS